MDYIDLNLTQKVKRQILTKGLRSEAQIKFSMKPTRKTTMPKGPQSTQKKPWLFKLNSWVGVEGGEFWVDKILNY